MIWSSPARPKSASGFSNPDPERPLFEQRSGQPARPRERRHHERVEPDRESGNQSRQRAAARRALPEDASEHCRGELRDGRERDQSDRHQRVRLARDAEIQIPEQQHEHDGATADPQQQSRQIRPLAQPQSLQPQQHRHHQVVAHHRRQGDGLDDHHAGRGGKPADEHQQREQLLLLDHRQRQDERVRVDTPVGKVHPAAERDRQYEDVDREHVDGEQPDRLLQMVFIDVLDHRDLKLARQEHDREHGQDRQPDPARIASRNTLERSEHGRELRFGGRAREHVPEAVVDPEGHERADREEREQLHERLERDCGHHALVMLGGVEVTRPEGNREQRQDKRHPQRGVLQDRHRRHLGGHDDLGILDENREAARDRLQLQRNVGNDPDDRDDGHDAAEERALPIAGGDEVGERGDAVLLRDAQDLAHDDPPEGDHQGRPDVDREEPDAVARGAPHAAVKGPSRRVDRQREAVDIWVGDHRAAGVGALVRVIGDREKEAEVRERGYDDYPALEHGSRSAPACAVRSRVRPRTPSRR